MKIKKSIIVLFAGLISLSACNSNAPVNFAQFNSSLEQANANAFSDASSVVEIKLKNQDDLINVSTKGLDVFGYDSARKTIRARVNKSEQKLLDSQKFSYQVIKEKNMTSRGLMAGYSTVEEIHKKLADWAKDNPEIVTLMDIGDSWEKTQGKSPANDIFCISISNKTKKGSKPASLFIGGMHARELAPPEIMMKLAELLITQYGKDQMITNLVDTRDINIVPVVNVDGRIRVEQGNNWQRKNTHGSGVDLNRNFDSYWNYQGLNVPSSWVGSATNPNSETYSGSGPASEPEVQAIQNFYKKKKLNMVLDMHSYGEMFFWPVGYSDKEIPEAKLFRNIYENSFRKIGYSGGTSMQLLYPTTATTDDYAYVKHKALGLGMEVGTSFRPSYSELERMWNELRPNLLYLLQVSNQTLGRR